MQADLEKSTPKEQHWSRKRNSNKEQLKCKVRAYTADNKVAYIT